MNISEWLTERDETDAAFAAKLRPESIFINTSLKKAENK